MTGFNGIEKREMRCEVGEIKTGESGMAFTVHN